MHRTHRHLRLVPPLDSDLSPHRAPTYAELDDALDDIVETLAAVQAADDERHAAFRRLRAGTLGRTDDGVA